MKNSRPASGKTGRTPRRTRNGPVSSTPAPGRRRDQGRGGNRCALLPGKPLPGAAPERRCAVPREELLDSDQPVRLQKWLAAAGLCSRREGELWIAEGRVKVNGVIVSQPGTKVGPKDRVSVEGRSVHQQAEPRLVLALHKPPGVLCTRNDPRQRPTVFKLLGSDHGRLIGVGRLDYNSEGLLLFTNDGQLAHRLMHPSSQLARTYRVRVHGRVDPATLEILKQGVVLEDGPTGPLEVAVDRVPGANSWLTITLREGRNRIVRRIFDRMEMPVSRLIRIAYGNITLGDTPRGEWRVLDRAEIKGLLGAVTADPVNRPRGERDS